MRDVGLFEGFPDDFKLNEPFKNLLTQGMVVAPTFYRDKENGQKEWINPADVDVLTDDKSRPISATLIKDGKPVCIGGIEKMAKSKNNGVDPQALIDIYGADTARLFIMFASPPDMSLEWSDAGVEGAHRFLKRLWRLVFEHVSQSTQGKVSAFVKGDLSAELKTFRRQLHQTIAKVTDDYGRRIQFNTAIASVMELLNAYAKLPVEVPWIKELRQETLETVALLLFPIVPHISEAIYAALCPHADLANLSFPKVDETALVQEEIELVLQINGKHRGSFLVAANATKEAIEQIALNLEATQKQLNGALPKKIIVVPNRLVNIVI